MTLRGVRFKAILLVAMFVAVIAGLGGYNLYQNSLQPRIQVTAADVHVILKEPRSASVVSQIEFRENGMFSHLVNKTGLYSIVFSDPCSDCSDPPSVVLTLTTAWGDDKIEEIEIPRSGSESLQVYLESNQQIVGRFTIFNPPSNRMLFEMLEVTGSQLLALSFTLTNNGPANGLADVVVQAEGKEVWVNRYFIQAGEQIRENAEVSFPSLEEHDFKVEVALQQKA